MSFEPNESKRTKRGTTTHDRQLDKEVREQNHLGAVPLLGSRRNLVLLRERGASNKVGGRERRERGSARDLRRTSSSFSLELNNESTRKAKKLTG